MKHYLILPALLFLFSSLNAQPGALDVSFNSTDYGLARGANSFVFSTAVQSDGKILIGGQFTSYRNTDCNRIARLNSDGTLDHTFDIGSGADREIRSIVVQEDGKILIAGRFESYNGIIRDKIARLNADGSLDTTFDPGSGAIGSQIHTMVIQSDGKIIIAGEFSSFNGVERNNIVRLNEDGSLDTTFDIGFGTDDLIFSLALQLDGKILIGGNFRYYNGAYNRLIARINSDGSLDTSFDIGGGPNGSVTAIALQTDGKILIGGLFTTYDENELKRVARLNTDGSLDNTFDLGFGASKQVRCISIQKDGKILIGGWDNFFRLNTDGTRDTDFSGATGYGSSGASHIYSISLFEDGKLLIGGYFDSYNGSYQNHVAKVESNGDRDINFDRGRITNGDIRTMAVDMLGRTLISGGFFKYGEVTRHGIARINIDGSIDTSFVPEMDSNLGISAISIQADGRILIAGFFSFYNETVNGGIVRLNEDGSLDTSFDPGLGTRDDAGIISMAIQEDGKILIGGVFTLYDGVSRNRIARLNADGSIDESFDPGQGADGSVRNIQLQNDNKIILGGFFDNYDGIARKGIVRLSADGSIDTSFDPGDGVTEVSAGVTTIQVQADNKIIVGGSFTQFDQKEVNRIIRLNDDGSLDDSFIPSSTIESSVSSSLIQEDGKILIGTFSYGGITRLNSDGSLDATFDRGTGADGNVEAIVLQSEGRVLISGDFEYYNGIVRSSIARIITDGCWGPELVVNNEESTVSVSDEYETYQWYRNETPLNGQISNVLYVDNHGSYHVAVENSEECIALSEPFVVDELLVTEIKVVGVSCEGTPDGAVRIFTSGGNGSLNYSSDGINFQTSNRLFQLSQGTQEITVRSALTGYSISQNVEIPLEEATNEYSESFETHEAIKLLNSDGSYTWSLTTAGKYAGNTSLYMNFYNYVTVGEEDYYLLSKPISSSKSMLLSFAYAYTKYANDLNANDSLTVIQSFDCGTSWEVLDQIGGDEMMTAEPTNDAFVPSGKDQWAVRSVSIESSENEYLLALKAINGYGNILFIDSLTLVPENHAPSLTNTNFEIEENSQTDTVVGTIEASDEDGDDLVFAISSGNTDNAFSLNSTSGELTVKTQSALDFETTQGFSLEVEVNDGNGGVASATITVNIIDVNETPSVEVATFTIAENSSSGTSVGTIEATDPDGDALTYSILSGNTGEGFSLNSETGELTVQTQSALDFETTPVFNLEVEVNDGNGGTASATITVDLNDVDESSNTSPTIASQTFDIDENSPNSTIVGQLVATDEDGDDLSFSILSGNTNDVFALSASGELTVQTSSELDFEATESFSLLVEVNDGNGGTASATITVELNDVDESSNTSPTIANQIFDIDENSPNSAIVGQVSATDPDGDDLSFTILSGNINDAFALSTTGELTVQNSSELDFETIESFSLEVEVNDGNGGTASATITVELNDVDESSNTAPTIANQIFDIDENSPNSTIVGQLVATDVDDDDLSFSIISGNTNDAFALSTTGELTVQTSSELDFETTPTVNIEVEVNDGNGGNAQATITVDLNNSDETALIENIFQLPENSMSGTIIGSVGNFEAETELFPYLEGNSSQIDQNDEAQVRGIELINAGALEISADTYDLVLATDNDLDFESFQSFKVIVKLCCFTAGSEPSTIITVDIVNVNESTTIEDQSFVVDENSPSEAIVGQIEASDEDGDDISFTILSGNINDAFALSTTGELTVQNSSELDFETTERFSLEVEVNDGNGGTASATITIDLNDLDETKPLALDDDVQVLTYPNPTSGKFILSVPDFLIGEVIELYDFSGKKILQMNMELHETTIDISDFPDGIYLLNIRNQIIKVTKAE